MRGKLHPAPAGLRVGAGWAVLARAGGATGQAAPTLAGERAGQGAPARAGEQAPGRLRMGVCGGGTGLGAVVRRDCRIDERTRKPGRG